MHLIDGPLELYIQPKTKIRKIRSSFQDFNPN